MHLTWVYKYDLLSVLNAFLMLYIIEAIQNDSIKKLSHSLYLNVYLMYDDPNQLH